VLPLDLELQAISPVALNTKTVSSFADTHRIPHSLVTSPDNMLSIVIFLPQLLLCLIAAQMASLVPFAITSAPQLAIPIPTSLPRTDQYGLLPRDSYYSPNGLCGTACIYLQNRTCCTVSAGYDAFACPVGNNYCGPYRCCMDMECFFSYGTDSVVTTRTSTGYTVLTEWASHHAI